MVPCEEDRCFSTWEGSIGCSMDKERTWSNDLWFLAGVKKDASEMGKATFSLRDL